MSNETIKSNQTETVTADVSVDSPLIAKLKKNKAAKAGQSDTTLPETGIVVTWPTFQSHAAWMKAQRLAKKDFAKATNIYLIGICKFDGEKMTLSDFIELIPSNDIFHLTNEVMGKDDEGDDEDDEGNVLH